MKSFIYLALLGTVTLFSCEKILMEPNPKTDNLSIFEEYWKLVDEKFAMFSDPGKNLDRAVLYTENRALINNDISLDSLFGVLSNITWALKDGHSFLNNVEDPAQFTSYHENWPVNLDQSIVDDVYMDSNTKTQGSGLRYTLFETDNIGYIEYRKFDEEVSSEMMDEILTYFKNTKGIIIDVRGNSGGDPEYAAIMAGHFTDAKTYIGYEDYKTGPGINDFSKSELYVEPADGVKYLEPVVVLTDGLCFSATTTFIYHLNPLPNITFIGAKTGGGSGAVADGFLANGWQWALSTSEFIDWEGRRLDNGFDPDIAVSLDSTNTTQDEIIERAILELK